MSDCKKLLVIGLDGFDPVVGASLMQEGKLPNLERLDGSAHRFRLDPGFEKYTGLAWEHFSSGLTPQEASRWSAIAIDAQRYLPDQPTTRCAPFTEKLHARTAVFDTPYFDLAQTRSAQGMTSWGSHDPGVSQCSVPSGLAEEIVSRFGEYPASEFIYAHVWPNAELAAEMGRAMIAAVNLRSDITSWLFGERLEDWDLAITVISEYHSATEALWHGWDETHPLHGVGSAAAAREGLVGVYQAADAMLGRMIDEFHDASVLAFTPHGMGRNKADVAAMLLLPELIYRHCTGKIGFDADPSWEMDGTGSSDLLGTSDWSRVVNQRLRVEQAPAARPRWRFQAPPPQPRPHLEECVIDWMPAARYRAAWPGMEAYAMPAYYHGLVRINLKGREVCGVTPLRRYRSTLDQIADVIQSCRDPSTGDPIEVEIEHRLEDDPRDRHPTDVDLIVRFQKDYYAFEHKELGLIGPAPCRRPGGHTGGDGVGYYLIRQHRGGDLGTFRTLDLSNAVAALIGNGSAVGGLAEALRRASLSG